MGHMQPRKPGLPARRELKGEGVHVLTACPTALILR